MVSVATAILIRRNLKRHWGRLVTLGILTLLAAAVANLAMIVATGYNSPTSTAARRSLEPLI